MRSRFHVCFPLLAIAAFVACSSTDSTPNNDGPGGSTPDGGGGEEGGDLDGQVPADVTSPPGSKVTTTTEAIDVDGTSRKYILSVPKTYDAARAYPLIVALHGDGQDAAGFVPFSKLDTFTGSDAILAFTDQSLDLFTPYEQNGDQRLVEVLIDAMKAKFSIDAAKIWGFGYSKGAYQLNEIACKKPGLLSAMAIHAGGAPQTRDANDAVDCPAAVGLPAFITHGANDLPGGGEFGAQYWASKAGCQDTRSPTQPEICAAYDGCQAGKPVVFCLVPDQPHYPMYDDAAEHSWAWFKTL